MEKPTPCKFGTLCWYFLIAAAVLAASIEINAHAGSTSSVTFYVS